jgi:L-ascorbate metabolism protein UlaG (beta-lactamase superfamily)
MSPWYDGRMKVTKYPQSTLVIENEGRKILIDPGNFTAEKYTAEEFLGVEAIVLTHQHFDHVDRSLISAILAQENAIPVIANQDTYDTYPDLVTQVIHDREKIEIAGFRLEARDLPHVLMVDGSAGPPNTGFIVNDRFFHAGDGVEINDLEVDIIAAPIAGPDLSLRDAHDLIIATEAKVVIPIHYSIFSDDKPAKAVWLLEHFTPNIEVRVLANAESTNI